MRKGFVGGELSRGLGLAARDLELGRRSCGHPDVRLELKVEIDVLVKRNAGFARGGGRAEDEPGARADKFRRETIVCGGRVGVGAVHRPGIGGVEHQLAVTRRA